MRRNDCIEESQSTLDRNVLAQLKSGMLAVYGGWLGSRLPRSEPVTLLFYLSKTPTFSVDTEHLQHMAPLSFGPNAICSASGLHSRDTTWSKAGKNGRQPTSADKCLTLEAAAAAGGVLMFQKVQHEFSAAETCLPLT